MIFSTDRFLRPLAALQLTESLWVIKLQWVFTSLFFFTVRPRVDFSYRSFILLFDSSLTHHFLLSLCGAINWEISTPSLLAFYLSAALFKYVLLCVCAAVICGSTSRSPLSLHSVIFWSYSHQLPPASVSGLNGGFILLLLRADPIWSQNFPRLLIKHSICCKKYYLYFIHSPDWNHIKGCTHTLHTHSVAFSHCLLWKF